ncbi:MAG: hypothetical protein ACI4I4_01780 [Acutalibacteraceae bacterium]
MAQDEKKTPYLQKIKGIFENDKYKKMLIICGLLGIALIFLSSFFENKDTSSGSTVQTVYTANQSIEQYKEDTEINLGNMIASIDGAGKTKIMVTVDSGIEYVYASDEKESVNSKSDKSQDKDNTENTQDSEKSYITIRLSDGTQQAVTVKEIQPRIRGVLVICEGGGDALVQQRVIEAVTKALDISSAKVCVTKLSN